MFQLFCVACCFYIIWKLLSSRKTSLDPPELSGWLPLIGHAHRFYGDSKKIYKTLFEITEECQRKGGVLTWYFGPRKVYGVTDPEDCLTLASECIKKEHSYNMVKAHLGNGIILSSGAKWKKHRKLISPAFSQPVLNSFMGVFNSQARRLVEQFADEVGKPFDHEHLLRLNNLETICLTSTGVGGEKYSRLLEQYLPLLTELHAIFNHRFMRLWLHSDFIFSLSPLKRKQDEVAERLLQLSRSIVQTKKAEMNSFGQRVSDKSEKLKSFMELILDIANDTGSFTDEEIREETENIIAAGHDTSASVLTFTFIIIGSYPDVQRKIYEEIQSCLGNSDRDLDKEDVSKLAYTEAVIKETMRLYPIASLIGRFTEKPVQLKNYTIEAKTGVYFLVNGVHRHPMWGPDATLFRPERWMEPDKLPDLSFFGGFGMGRRHCLGKAYALMSMKTIISHMLRHYKISSDVTQMVLRWAVMTRPASGYYITLERRLKHN